MRSGPQCNLCGSRKFKSIPNRPTALRCTQCGSMPRTRMLGLTITRAAPLTSLPVVHFAPERGLSPVLQSRYGALWTPTDIDPDRYRKDWIDRPVQFADLSEASRYFQPYSTGGFVHSHVLEHVPAPIEDILSAMNRSVAPGGFHAFVVPIRTDYFEEDMDLTKPDSYRLERFGHVGHVRNFGRLDFEKRVLSHFKDWHQIPINEIASEAELDQSAIPAKHVFNRYSGSTAFIFVKK